MSGKKLTTADFDPRVLGLFDRYVHGLIDPREFLRGSAAIVGSTAAVGVLAALQREGGAGSLGQDARAVRAAAGRGRRRLTQPAQSCARLSALRNRSM